MKLRRKKLTYRLPRVGSLISVTVKIGSDIPTVLEMVDGPLFAKTMAANPGVLGRPHIGHLDEESVLSVYPPAASDGELVIRYFPPEISI